MGIRIIRPYGRSIVDNKPDPSRKLHPKNPDSSGDTQKISQHAQNKDELVIAQWISAIDKIASKPFGAKGATDEQRTLRRELGDAAWCLLEQKSLLPGLADDKKKPELKKTWEWKLHPYDAGQNKDKKQTNPPEAKGRWYKRFAGDIDPAQIDGDRAKDIAAEIHKDLYECQFSFTDKQPSGSVEKPQGRIALRASSIEKNVLVRQMEKRNDKPVWDDNDKKAYAEAGDVAACIDARITRIKNPERKRRLYVECAAQPLHDHYSKLFQDEHKNILHVREASTRHPGLFALHQAVKHTCKSLLEGRSKKALDVAFPKTIGELLQLVEKRRNNQDINALIRLGRIIHYQAMHDAGNKPVKNRPLAPVITNWPEDIASSRYWGSDGQAEIKRNEAFVRVWRNTLSMASRTLTDWADPKGQQTDDILGHIEDLTGDSFDGKAYEEKLPLLFGKRKDLFDGNDEYCKTILETALRGLAGLRNAAFHFKGIDNFTHALENSLALENSPKSENTAANAIASLWEDDERDNAERVLKDMKAAYFARYFNHDQNKKLFKAVLNTDLPGLPLPRFRRMLARADNAWEGKDSLLLPRPANQQELENPARNCQYQALKLLYERVFPDWLAKQSAEKLNEHIEKAEGRATDMAKAMNDELAVWKAAGRFGLQQGESIADFLSRISAETASEMRVQKGYESDPEKARKQAKYLEDIRCDLIALAFVEWLQKKKFEYLLCNPPQGGKKKALYWKLGDPHQGKEKYPAFDRYHKSDLKPLWPKTLYFLLHLVPVDEIARLRHQINKWALLEDKAREALEDKDKTRKALLRRTLTLYQDMHDAKFEGGDGLMVPPERLEKMYDSQDAYNKIFGPGPDNGSARDAGDDIRIPRRGLREMLRFGHIACLWTVFKKHQISAEYVKEVQEMEHKTDGKSKSRIAHQQEDRTRLHKKWVEGKKPPLSKDEIDSYERALQYITRHRQLSAQVYLKDHVRLHQLLMRILGRLVDYAGLWERDLYFVTLALIYSDNKHLKDSNEFSESFLEWLGNGQIVMAVNKAPKNLKSKLEKYFVQGVLDKKTSMASSRNRFSHFNMLREDKPLNLTDEINQARRMLSYDRKLKNAVSKSIMDLLHREGLTLRWKKCSDHQLSDAVLDTRRICHLGKKCISEDLHGKDYVAMVAHLFGGTVLEGGHGQQAKKPGKSRH